MGKYEARRRSWIKVHSSLVFFFIAAVCVSFSFRENHKSGQIMALLSWRDTNLPWPKNVPSLHFISIPRIELEPRRFCVRWLHDMKWVKSLEKQRKQRKSKDWIQNLQRWDNWMMFGCFVWYTWSKNLISEHRNRTFIDAISPLD